MSRPILEAVLGIALLSVMDSLIKGLVARYPVAEIAFIRYVVGSLTMLVLLGWARPGWPTWETLRANGLRALLVVVTALTFFYGIGQLPLAEALVLSFISPIFTAVFAALVLRERLDMRVLAALAAGFCGVLAIVLGKSAEQGAGEAGLFGGSLAGVIAILISAVTYSASNVLLRARAQRDSVVMIVGIQNIVPGLILATPALILGEVPAVADRPALMMLGLLGVAGHLLIARAYARVQAVRLAPLEYTALIWAVLIGYFAFAEVPRLGTGIGAALILGAALIATRRREQEPA